MTVIAGIADGSRVWIGGDSAGVSALNLTIRKDTKVFHRGPFLVGFTSSFRMGQLLQYSLDTPERPEGISDHEYMATRFVDAVRSCLKAGGYARKENEEESGGTFLVGYHGHLYCIESDYQVGETASGYDAVGCGFNIALGSLYSTDDPLNHPRNRIRIALNAAATWSAGVSAPFVIEELA